MIDPSDLLVILFVVLFCVGVAVILAGVFVVFVEVIAPLFQRGK